LSGYTIKEIYYTLQGEGARAGRPAVLCRFSGCNLWSGLEADRAEAECGFCDTDFVGTDGRGGGNFADAGALARAIVATWPSDPRASTPPRPYLFFTGGEPLLQLDAALVDACHRVGFEVAVESNGTLPAPSGLDWLTVSPKAGAPFVQRTGDELKLAYPQASLTPESVAGLEFRYYYLQPIDGPDLEANTRQALHYCLRHPQWRLSLQLHKILGIR
jgi:7-carboxy-7-deazaguanine synthase (Cx14CxxC type)